MADENPFEPPSARQRVKRRRGLGWFIGGFASVFVLVLIFYQQFFLTPAGDSLIRCSLGQFYWLELQHLFQAGSLLGPKSGSASGLMRVFCVHMAFSIIGGFVSWTIGLFFRRP